MIILEPLAGATAWVLISAALVVLMTPGLAMFYGGMVRANSVLNMMMMCFAAMAIVSVLWVLFGYGLAFGDDMGLGLLGNPKGLIGLTDLLGPGADGYGVVTGAIPALGFAAFQSAFAIIAVALVSGAVADRMAFSAWLVFVGVWSTIVYFPVAHWVFAVDGMTSARGGWIVNNIGAIDYAGGTAIHINAGTAGLVLAVILGPRVGFGKRPMRPHNMTLVMMGAALLWFGWFGFNAGSALNATWDAAAAWINTLVAGSAAIIGWIFTERIRDGHFTSLGAASGAVAGLVAITPGCASVTPVGAILIGAISGCLCAMSVGWKFRFRYDDSLDVVGIHLVGGLIGTLAIGFFATGDAPTGVAGLFYGGGLHQLGAQVVGALSVMAYSAAATAAIGLVLRTVMRIRIPASAEVAGIDLWEHAEVGYDLSNVRYTSYQGIGHQLLIPARDSEDGQQ